MRLLLFCVAILLAFSALPLRIFYWAFASGESGCAPRQVFVDARSPDGAWVARGYKNMCWAGFVTTLDDTVGIARPNEPEHPQPNAGVVFAMDDSAYENPSPLALRWLDAKQLEITIPNHAWAGKQQSAFADVTISYKYVPDDPVERTCLKRWRALPTEEMVRRNPSATENIKAFLIQCHAADTAH
jgi:hypothetical protein